MVKQKRFKFSFPYILSISIHVIVALIVMSVPIHNVAKKIGSSIDVDWVRDVSDPIIKKAEPPKELISLKKQSEKDMKDGSKKKTILASASKLTWVLKKSDRKVERSVEINKFPKREAIPDILTATQLKNEDSNLSQLISTKVGPVDGDGVVGNQVRAKGTGGEGTRSGATILGLGGKGDGTWGDGLTGSGGGRGTGTGDGMGKLLGDHLGIIDFLDELGGSQKVVYCLDISSSMAIGTKLDISLKAISESLLQLDDSDLFNIVIFHSAIKSFKDEAVPATLSNVEKASKFLNNINTRNIETNLGTDILGALKYSLNMEPNVIVIVTDIQPTKGEVDPEAIANEIKKINKNTKIYGVGIETWEPSPTGKLAKLLKLLTEQNNGEMRLAKAGFL